MDDEHPTGQVNDFTIGAAGETHTGDILVDGPIHGILDIQGTFDGDLCGENLRGWDPLVDSLPTNITVEGFGADATICGALACGPGNTVAPPTGEIGAQPRNRYLAITPGNTVSRIQVSVISSEPFPEIEGMIYWVGQPSEVPDEDSGIPGQMISVASLQCEDPGTVHDWSGLLDGKLYIYGAEVLPESAYEVKEALTESACGVSAAVSVSTGKFGDLTTPFASEPDAPTQPDFSDIAALVAKFLAESGAPSKTYAQLQPNAVFPSRPIDFKDIAVDVSAFLGNSYASIAGITGGCTCPSAVTCGATACTGDSICTPGFCIGGFCTDECGRCAP